MSTQPETKPWPITDLAEIGERLRTQDNQCTAEPMFCVEVKRREYGYMPEYCDETVWIDTLDDCMEIPEPENPTDGQVETGFKDVWERVMTAFTREGAEDYIRQNGHNHRGEKRIYVESFRRCEEMIAIRKYLMSLPKP